MPCPVPGKQIPAPGGHAPEGKDDHVVRVAAALDRIANSRAFLGEDFDEAFTYAALRKAETIGRPVGSTQWLEDMAAKTGQPLRPGKRGPKPKAI